MNNPSQYPATILGNGRSRLVLDLDQINAKTVTYGCNAIHRDFITDYLIALDPDMVFEIIDNNAHLKSKFYTQSTRRLQNRLVQEPELKKSCTIIDDDVKSIDSGNTAIRLACFNKHTVIYLVGFDHGIMLNEPRAYNNVYRSTPNYLPISNVQVNVANARSWRSRMLDTIQLNPDVMFKRVVDQTEKIKSKLNNYSEMTPEQFNEEIMKL